MTPVRAAAIVRGDVPGLLRRGMPVYPPDTDRPLNPDEHDSAVVCAMPDADWLSVEPGASTWIGYARFNTWRRPRPVKPHLLTVDFTDPAALYLSLHWLADRGHTGCLWMLPTTHGGRVEAWDGLTAWEVAAVLVSVSVGRVAAGKDPVPSMLCPWRHDPNPGDAYESWGWTAWMRDSVGDRGAARTYTPTRPTPDRWNGARWLYYRDRYGGVAPTKYGPETGDAGKLAADTAALADGCCLLAPGGLVVPA